MFEKLPRDEQFKVITELLSKVRLYKSLATKDSIIYYQMRSLEFLILELEASGRIREVDIKDWNAELSELDFLIDRII